MYFIYKLAYYILRALKTKKMYVQFKKTSFSKLEILGGRAIFFCPKKLRLKEIGK